MSNSRVSKSGISIMLSFLLFLTVVGILSLGAVMATSLWLTPFNTNSLGTNLLAPNKLVPNSKGSRFNGEGTNFFINSPSHRFLLREGEDLSG